MMELRMTLRCDFGKASPQHHGRAEMEWQDVPIFAQWKWPSSLLVFNRMRSRPSHASISSRQSRIAEGARGASPEAT